MKIWKESAAFALGGAVYTGMELLWRGRSHVSMFAAGGLSLVLVGHLGQTELPLALRIPLGAAIITMVELGTGLLVNRSYKVWDYRNMPGNLWGQVCPQFFGLWLVLSWVAMVIYEKMMKVMK